MDNKILKHHELVGMTDSQLETHGYKRRRFPGGAVAIQKIQEGPREAVAKLEEIHPDSIILDAIFPPKPKANDFSLFAGYFLEQILGQYIHRIQSAGLLRDQEIKGIINILEHYDYLRIREYLLALPVSEGDNSLSMKNTQLSDKITLDDRTKLISEAVGTLRYQLESWQKSQK